MSTEQPEDHHHHADLTMEFGGVVWSAFIFYGAVNAALDFAAAHRDQFIREANATAGPGNPMPPDFVDIMKQSHKEARARWEALAAMIAEEFHIDMDVLKVAYAKGDRAEARSYIADLLTGGAPDDISSLEVPPAE